MKRSTVDYVDTKDALIRFAAAAIRFYLQHWPMAAGKTMLWQRLVRPYIVWRSLPVVAHTKFNMTVRGSFPDLIHSYLYFFGVWEPGISHVIAHHLRPGDTAIDIGANVGAHTMLAASIVGAEGRVYAIEASPAIFKYLKENLEYNGLRQVVAVNLAVWDHAAPTTVLLHTAHNLGRTTIVRQQADPRDVVEEMQVEGRPLAEIVPPDVVRAARLVKIDVEGAEWPVLQGMRELVSSLHNECIVLVEVNSDALAHFGASLPDVLYLFRSAGWQVLEIANSYKPDFYLRTLHPILSTDIRIDSPVIDLGFCRPSVLRELLARDRCGTLVAPIPTHDVV